MERYAIGSSLDSFLEEQGIFEECTVQAAKAVLAWQLEEAMKEKQITKTELAARMKTSRSSVNRLLDPNNPSASLHTLERAALALGRRLEIRLA
jgi:DNA-binding Xre family transcriptional regulator